MYTSKAFCDSRSIQAIAWSEVVLHDSTTCSNRPSTGIAVLTSGGNLPHLQMSSTVVIKHVKGTCVQQYRNSRKHIHSPRFFMSFSSHDGYADCDVATYVLTITNFHDNKPKSYITNNPYPVYVMRQLASCN